MFIFVVNKQTTMDAQVSTTPSRTLNDLLSEFKKYNRHIGELDGLDVEDMKALYIKYSNKLYDIANKILIQTGYSVYSDYSFGKSSYDIVDNRTGKDVVFPRPKNMVDVHNGEWTERWVGNRIGVFFVCYTHNIIPNFRQDDHCALYAKQGEKFKARNGDEVTVEVRTIGSSVKAVSSIVVNKEGERRQFVFSLRFNGEVEEYTVKDLDGKN